MGLLLCETLCSSVVSVANDTEPNFEAPRRDDGMAAYAILNLLEITDRNGWEEYRSNIEPVLTEFGARVIAADPGYKVLEGEWNGVSNVIIEFPDLDAADRLYSSEEYRPLLEARLGATRGNLIVLDGI